MTTAADKLQEVVFSNRERAVAGERTGQRYSTPATTVFHGWYMAPQAFAHRNAAAEWNGVITGGYQKAAHKQRSWITKRDRGDDGSYAINNGS